MTLPKKPFVHETRHMSQSYSRRTITTRQDHALSTSFVTMMIFDQLDIYISVNISEGLVPRGA